MDSLRFLDFPKRHSKSSMSLNFPQKKTRTKQNKRLVCKTPMSLRDSGKDSLIVVAIKTRPFHHHLNSMDGGNCYVPSFVGKF